MLVQKSYKTELDPTNKQITLFRKACGVRRFAYNWGLNKKITQYEDTGKSDNFQGLLKDLNKIKDKEFPWMREVSTYVVQSAIHDLDEAYSHFFRRVKNGEKPGFPKFKSKKNGLGGFRLYNIIGKHVQLSGIKFPRIGLVKLKEQGYLPTSGVKINSATIKEHAGKWFVSLQVEESVETPNNQGEVVALDLGLDSFIHDSNNDSEDAPKPLKKSLDKLIKLSRQHSKKKKGSNSREKARKKLAKLHYKISCQRNDFLHKLSTNLTKTKLVIVVEDLNVSGMVRNHKLARSINDVSWSMFVSMLDYKSKWYGSTLFKVDRFYPSTQLCSNCGNRKIGEEKIGLDVRLYHCDKCNFECGRDYNASLNLLNYYNDMKELERRNTVRSTEMKPVETSTLVESMKQEPSILR